MRAWSMIVALLVALPAHASGDDGDPPAPAPVPEAPAPVLPHPAPPSPAPATRAELTLQPSRSLVYALVYKKGAAAAFAHDHVIHAPVVSGTALIDPDDPAASRVEVTVSVADFDPDSDAMREKLGLPRRLDEGQRDTILGHIKAEFQLYVAKYATTTFRSTSVTRSGDAWSVTGDFTLRGVTRRLTIPVTLTPEGPGWRARATFRINQSDYGYDPYYAMAGALQVEDAADVVIDAYLSP